MFQILIVEDDKELSQLFQKVLEKNGYQVKSAPDGAQALEVLDKEYIDLIISDIMMPVMDGYELVSELRSAGYQIPVLMITDKESLVLPKKEFLLLYKLAASPGRTFTKQQLMDEVWGYETEADPHTIEVHIGRIRERFKDNPNFEIVTMRGIGYKVVKK